jgi:two-component system, NtrC family, sensor histidine kinase GlrK
MPALPRPSFRQLLLVAFLLVAFLLAAVALRGLATFESLLQRSRSGAERSLALNGHVDRLGEHGVTMERAARQYLVLQDPVLLDTFQAAAGRAAAEVRALQQPAPGSASAAPVDRALTAQWREQMAVLRGLVQGAGASPGLRDAQLALGFGELVALHAHMAEQVRSATESRNLALQAELDSGRALLMRQVLGAIALAVALALGLALALARPLRRVEKAIDALGENRLDTRIDIPGPSDVRQIGRRLDGLRLRLAELEADKARFLRHVSHELKTPLAALREGVALLGDEVAGPLSDNQREVARILRDNTATLQRRIEDLLQFNAAAFAAQRLVRRPVDVTGWMAALVDEQQLQWRSQGLLVHTEGPAVQAEIDATLLGSAVSNLLSNAIRYSPPGATIHLLWHVSGDGLVIEVADQGPGIAAAERTRIFEPFFRGAVQPDGGLPGTGIGLSIVAETVAAHGGRITLAQAEAAPTLGTAAGARFRIELPHALVR